jgi:polysaccharide export outer membrane protein
VQVAQINSKKYFIQGEVLKPGPNPLVVPTNVLEALVNAGGFKDFANTKKIEIIRSTGERFKFNYKDVIHGKHMEQNILLKPGDIIVVP